MRLTFKGGVHPFEGKEMSKDCPVEKYLPKADLAYPLSQHIGAPAKPVVAMTSLTLMAALRWLQRGTTCLQAR